MDVDYLNSLPREILYDIIKKSNPDDILKLCSVRNNELCDYVKNVLISEYIGDFGFLMELSNLELSKLINILYPDNELLEKISSILLSKTSAQRRNPQDVKEINIIISIINRAVDLDIDVETLINDKGIAKSSVNEITDHILSRGKKIDTPISDYRDAGLYLFNGGDPKWLYDYLISTKHVINIEPKANEYDDYYYKFSWIKIQIVTYFYIFVLSSIAYPKLFFEKFKEYIMISAPEPFIFGYESSHNDVIKYATDLISNIDLRKVRNAESNLDVQNRVSSYYYLVMGYCLKDDLPTSNIMELLKLVSKEFYKFDNGSMYSYDPIPYTFLYNIGNIEVCRYVYELIHKVHIGDISQESIYFLAPYISVSPYVMIDNIINNIIINLGREDLSALKNTLSEFKL
ncbi:Transmembrane domain-containing protein [Orpheovirus IHUMI-LCC2]|uniref:Transmembrane domain-containing protein n=1 Tax=Orpheovirus IHUMI-LCC2 TaxID=2023057 RepID=A0A2I2L5H3_9VIRU|nr:Transmembrane domain-containing protein [Orpheovirus IHUMI-LCC2]SNW62805.1 Transmembrane domain-containing protein [Orpheovirus IHUMI-LCC2]